jgi:hypothetical protein
MPDNRFPPQPEGRDTGVSGDAVIGRAFRWSLLVILLLVVVGGMLAYLELGPAEKAPPGDDSPVMAPRKAEPKTAPLPRVSFTDITQSAGIDFVHENGAAGDRLLPETLGSGAAFLDFDNDGDQDLLLVNSDHWQDRRAQGKPRPGQVLYRNDGRGGFSAVGAEVGLDAAFYGMGAAVGDYDNDGFVDVFISALGENHLFHNRQGRFVEVTEAAGVGGAADAWSTSSAFFDFDNDGDLDLFVANYVRWSREVDLEVDFRLTGIGRAYGPPTAFEGTYAFLYRNEGDGRFTDVSGAAGIRIDNPATGRPMAKALGVVPIDIDGDAWIDLLVANDTVQNFWFRNNGDGTFEEIGTLIGVAFDRNGASTGAMGVDAAYYRNDPDIGLAVGNFANEMTSLYVTQGGAAPLADEAIVEGVGPASRQVLTFGLFFFDYDLDGRLDLLQANGHLEAEINKVQPSQHYAQPPQLFWNCGLACRTGFLSVPAQSMGDLGRPLVGRGAAYADVDGDGDLDVLITQNGRRAALLRNDQGLGNHWLRIRLIGRTVNRDAIGAWVELRVNGVTQKRQVMPTRSFLSQVELPLTFGLGKAESIEALRVHWPDGSVQDVSDVAIDSLLIVEQAP